jgi:hypothetical protein
VKVVYGHTDSIYVKIPSIEKAKEVVKEINTHVQKIFPNVLRLKHHPVELEFEKYYSSLGVGTTKNRNAGIVSWEDGITLEEPKFVMTGFTAKRISETQFAKRVQLTLLKQWVNGKSLSEIISYLNGEYKTMISGNAPLLDIIKRSRLKPERFKVKCSCKKRYTINQCREMKYCKGCGKNKTQFTTLEGKKPTFGEGIAGILYGQEKLSVEYDDSYLFLKVKLNDSFTHPLTDEIKKVDYVAFNKYVEFDNYIPNWEHYANQVIKKATPVFNAMGWDTSTIRTGRIVSEWW